MGVIDFHGRSFLRFIGRTPNKASVAAPEHEPTSDAATKTAAKHTCLTVVPRGINRPYMPSRQTWAELLRKSVQNLVAGLRMGRTCWSIRSAVGKGETYLSS